MCSETSSPRLSFSSDLGEDHNNNNSRSDTSVLDMACEFEFSFTCGLSAQESSSADELFSHGIILPTQPRESTNNNMSCSGWSNIPKPLPPLPKRERQKESDKTLDQNQQANKPQPKSFWGTFKRSTSLNSENKRSGLLSSLPLLSRSNSTGSAPKAMKSNSYSPSSSSSQRHPLIPMARSSSSSSSLANAYAMPHKPPLKKGYGGSYGNGVRIIPVINVPPPYISKSTAKLFGLGSFLPHGKDRKTKK